MDNQEDLEKKKTEIRELVTKKIPSTIDSLKEGHMMTSVMFLMVSIVSEDLTDEDFYKLKFKLESLIEDTDTQFKRMKDSLKEIESKRNGKDKRS